MTKPVTSVAVMMLLEQGKLSLDDPVSKYLPGFDHLQVLTKFNEATALTRPGGPGTTMTLRHLLTTYLGDRLWILPAPSWRVLPGETINTSGVSLLHDPEAMEPTARAPGSWVDC